MSTVCAVRGVTNKQGIRRVAHALLANALIYGFVTDAHRRPVATRPDGRWRVPTWPVFSRVCPHTRALKFRERRWHCRLLRPEYRGVCKVGEQEWLYVEHHSFDEFSAQADALRDTHRCAGPASGAQRFGAHHNRRRSCQIHKNHSGSSNSKVNR
jgi:hypothetical protein